MTKKTEHPSKKRLPGRPKKNKHISDNIEQQIIDYANVLFPKKGFAAVSMRDIVNGVGISLPTLYYYFSDKETLFAATSINLMQKANKQLQALTSKEESLLETLKELTNSYLQYSPVSIASLLRDVDEHIAEKHAEEIIGAYKALIIQPVLDLFIQANKSGELPVNEEKRLTELVQVFVSMVDSLKISSVSQLGDMFNASTYADTAVTIFWNGVKTVKAA